MPRIDAPNIQEHVRQQTERILTAANTLFQARGYRSTDLDGIAEAVGLARNSLYRYFRNKDEILLACVQRDMESFIVEMHKLDSAFPDPMDRIVAWLNAQIDLATSPATPRWK
ncbi:MAG: helix-turn-helix domain-containing protein [Gammaproteobacteria bacterium]